MSQGRERYKNNEFYEYIFNRLLTDSPWGHRHMEGSFGKQHESPPAVNEERLLIVSEDFPLPEETLGEIERVIKNPENYIDEGGAGKVYRLPGDLCIKVMEERHTSPHADKFDLGNTTSKELSFLSRLSKVKVKGVRSPVPVGAIENPNTGHMNAIVMEELPAINLQHILLGKVDFPKTFNVDIFFEALEAYIDHLHELGMSHQDLEARNVMVDKESGIPYVIDFGRSVYLNDNADIKKLTDNDWDHVEKMYEAVIKIVDK